MFEEIQKQTRQAVWELIEIAKLKEKDILIVGCSSSEVGGHKIGSDSSPQIADAIFAGLYPLLQ